MDDRFRRGDALATEIAKFVEDYKAARISMSENERGWLLDEAKQLVKVVKDEKLWNAPE